MDHALEPLQVQYRRPGGAVHLLVGMSLLLVALAMLGLMAARDEPLSWVYWAMAVLLLINAGVIMATALETRWWARGLAELQGTRMVIHSQAPAWRLPYKKRRLRMEVRGLEQLEGGSAILRAREEWGVDLLVRLPASEPQAEQLLDGLGGPSQTTSP